VKVYSAETQCHGKARFPTQRDAANVARSAANAGQGKLKPYHCPHCAGYHVGHKPIRRRRR